MNQSLVVVNAALSVACLAPLGCGGSEIAKSGPSAATDAGTEVGTNAGTEEDAGSFASTWRWVDPLPTGLSTAALFSASADEAWAGGNAAFLLHEQAGAWSVVPIPFFGKPDRVAIRSIWGRAADDVWAAGRAEPEGPLLLHWDGHRWSCAPLPPATHGLAGLWGSAGGDVFVIESYLGLDQSTLFRWDGAAWHSIGSATHTLVATWGSGANDVWFVGGRDHPAVTRLHGTELADVPLPAEETNDLTTDAYYGALSSIAGATMDDVWMVGPRGVYHWNGAAIEARNDVLAPGETARVAWHADDGVWLGGVLDPEAAAGATSGTNLLALKGFVKRIAGGDAASIPVERPVYALSSAAGSRRVWVGGSNGLLQGRDEPTPFPLHFMEDFWVTSDDAVFGIEEDFSLPSGTVFQRLLRYTAGSWLDTGLLGESGPLVSGASSFAGLGRDTWVPRSPMGPDLHWDGMAWSQVEGTIPPPMESDFAQRDEVKVANPDEIWATTHPSLGYAGALRRLMRCRKTDCAELASTFSDPLDFWGSGSEAWVVLAEGSLLHVTAQGSRSVPVDPLVAKCVWGSDPNNVWIAGTGGIAHFDGQTLAVEARAGEDLCPIAGRSPTDVWLAGTRARAPAPNCGAEPQQSGIVLHFAGSGWVTDTADIPFQVQSLRLGSNAVWVSAGTAPFFSLGLLRNAP